MEEDNWEEEQTGFEPAETKIDIKGIVTKIKELKEFGNNFMSQGVQIDDEKWYNAVGFGKDEVTKTIGDIKVGDSVSIELVPPEKARGYTNNIKSITKTETIQAKIGDTITSKITLDDLKVMEKALEDAQSLTGNPGQASNIAIALFQSRMKK
jgi:hypothetical protein